jgi:hypothetical protein
MLFRRAATITMSHKAGFCWGGRLFGDNILTRINQPFSFAFQKIVMTSKSAWA